MGNSGGKTTKQEDIVVSKDVQVLESNIGDELSESKEKKLRFSVPLEINLEREVNTNINVVQCVISEVQNSQQQLSPRVFYSKQEEKIFVSGSGIRSRAATLSNARSFSKSPARAISASRENVKLSPNNTRSKVGSKSPSRALSGSRRSIEKPVTPSRKAVKASPRNNLGKSMSKSPTRTLSFIQGIVNKPLPLKKVQTPSKSPKNKTKSVPATPKRKPVLSKSSTAKSKSPIRSSVSTKRSSSTKAKYPAQSCVSPKKPGTLKSATPKSTPKQGISSKFVNNKTLKSSLHFVAKSGGIKKARSSRDKVQNTSVAMSGNAKTKLNVMLAQCQSCVVVLDAKQVDLYLKQQNKKRKQTTKKIKSLYQNKNQTKKLPPRHLILQKKKRGAGLKK